MEAGSYIKSELGMNEPQINLFKDISILYVDELCKYIKKPKMEGITLSVSCCS